MKLKNDHEEYDLRSALEQIERLSKKVQQITEERNSLDRLHPATKAFIEYMEQQNLSVGFRFITEQLDPFLRKYLFKYKLNAELDK